MRGWIVGLFAAMTLVAGGARASTFAGTLSGNFEVNLWQSPLPFGRTLRVDFSADMSQLENVFLTLRKDTWLFGEYAPDTIDRYYDLSHFFTPTGFSIELISDTGDMCESDGYCKRTVIHSLYLQGTAPGGPVAYAGRIRAVSEAVPEPATWALLIAGFGLVGAAMRRRLAVA